MAKPLPKISVPTRHVYDVIVIGGQLSGLVAGALLQKRGHKVLVVDHDGLGAGYEHDGFLLPYSPFLAPPIKALPSLEEVFKELGLRTGLQRALVPYQPSLQLVLPRHRLDLSTDPERNRQELTREFGPSEGAAAASILGGWAGYHERSDPFFSEPLELPADGLKERWALRSRLKRHPELTDVPPASQNAALRLAEGLRPFCTYLASPETPVARGRPLSQLLAGPSHLPGGREGLRELFLRKLADLGGDVLAPEGGGTFVLDQLAFDGDRVAGVKLVQSEILYRATSFLGATDAGALRRLVEEKRKHKKLTDQLDLSRTRSFLFAINWVLPEPVLPRGMGELLLMDLGQQPGPMLIQVHPARRPGGKQEEDLRVVTAGAFVPETARERGEQHLRELQHQLGEALDGLLPFAREHLVSQSAPYLDAGGLRGSRLLPHPLLTVETDEAALGIEGLNQRTAAKNLFLSNREVLPGLGLEGELLAGARAARLVQQSAPKHKPL